MYGVSMPGMGDASMPIVEARAYSPLTTALPAWLTLTRGAGSWSRQTAAAAAGTTFVELGTAQNTGRFSYCSAAARCGLIIEPTRINLTPTANFVDVAPANGVPDGWADNGLGGAAAYTVVTPGAPHGGAYFQVTDPAVNGAGVAAAGATGAGSTYSMSAWMRRTGAVAAADALMFKDGAGNVTASLGAADFDWSVISVTHTNGGVGNNTFMGPAIAAFAGVLRICLPMLELGDYPTTPAVAAGAGPTRAAELCTVDTTIIGASSGFISFLWSPEYANSTFATIATLFEWAPNWRIDYNGGTDTFDVVVNGTIRATSAAQAFSAGQIYKLSVRYGTAGTVLTVDKAGSGAAQYADTNAWGNPALACYLGSRAASANCEGAIYLDFLSAA